jgi:hypothetical protein
MTIATLVLAVAGSVNSRSAFPAFFRRLSLPEGDHLRDATKMMPNFVTRGLARLDGLLDGG